MRGRDKKERRETCLTSPPRTQTPLKLIENLHAKEGEKDKKGAPLFSFPWFLALRHQPLTFRATRFPTKCLRRRQCPSDRFLQMDSSPFLARKCKKTKENLLVNHNSMHPSQKDGDWYIYPQFLAHENQKITHKNAQKSFINFKPRIGKGAITGTNFALPLPPPPPNMTLCVIDRLGSKGIVVKCTAAIFLFFQPLLYLAPLHMSPVDRDDPIS